MEKSCERCGTRSPGKTAGGFALFDYCAVCSRDLCDSCMVKGCCGNVPARSGNAEECDEDAALDQQIEAARQMRPQDWITTALDGFFAGDGRDMPAGMKGALVAKMTLACTGIQGEVEVEPFRRLLSEG